MPEQTKPNFEDFKWEAEQEVPARELKDLQAENRKEYEKWQKNLREVVSAMKRKKDALEEVVTAMHIKRAGQEDIRILILVMGGGMQGPYGAGQMCALQEMGYTTKNIGSEDTFLGISAGAATCAFGMAGKKQALLGTSYFYTICASKAFINFMRFHRVIDVSVIEQALRQNSTKLDTEAVRQNPAQFYVQAYNQSRSEPEFINVKNSAVDMITAIHGSMAVPLFYNKAVVLNDFKYTDGAFDDPMPIIRAIQQFKPTHILILPNIPFTRIPIVEPTRMDEALVKAIPNRGPLAFVRKILTSRQALRQSLELIEQTHHVKIGVAWPPEMGLNLFTQNVTKIKIAIKASAKSIFMLFGEPERELKLYEEEYSEEFAAQ